MIFVNYTHRTWWRGLAKKWFSRRPGVGSEVRIIWRFRAVRSLRGSGWHFVGHPAYGINGLEEDYSPQVGL